MMGEEVFMANRKNYFSWSPENRPLFSKLEFSAAPNLVQLRIAPTR